MLHHFIFILLKECLLTPFVTYSECCLGLENHEFSRFFLCSLFYRLEDTKRNGLDLTEFQNQVNYKVSEGIGDRFILTDLVIIYTLFGSSQSPVFLEITTITFLTRET